MAFTPGIVKPPNSGRKKGSKNKYNATAMVEEIVAASGKNPFQVMAELLDHKDPGIRLSASKELAQYMAPKRKAIEHSQSNSIQHKVTLLDGTTRVISSGDDSDEE